MLTQNSKAKNISIVKLQYLYQKYLICTCICTHFSFLLAGGCSDTLMTQYLGSLAVSVGEAATISWKSSQSLKHFMTKRSSYPGTSRNQGSLPNCSSPWHPPGICHPRLVHWQRVWQGFHFVYQQGTGWRCGWLYLSAVMKLLPQWFSLEHKLPLRVSQLLVPMPHQYFLLLPERLWPGLSVSYLQISWK